MGIKNAMFGAAVSVAIVSGANNCFGQNMGKQSGRDTLSVQEQVNPQGSTKLNIKEDAKDQIFVCLEKDDETSFRYTKAMESITDPYNTILEFPVEHLFQKYGEKKQLTHPLCVSGIARNMGALLGVGGIQTSDVSQSLNPRLNDITSETRYEVGDTLRVRLIDADLLEYFPENLSDQLKEEGFETFFDKDSLLIKSLNLRDTLQILAPEKIDSIAVQTGVSFGDNEFNDYIYDIVTKTLPSGMSALALYRNGKLFMTSMVSVGVPGHNTRKGQFEIIDECVYARSPQYGNSPMSYALKFAEHYYFHQGKVTGQPLSHGCVRLPGIKSLALYSAVKGKNHTDVYIDKKLNQPKTKKTYIRQKK